MNLKKNLKIIFILIILFTLPSFFSVCFQNPFRLWDTGIFDFFFKLRFFIRGSEIIAPDLYLFNITDFFDHEYPDNHIDRTIYARILEKLHSAGVSTIVYDIFFQGQGLESGDAKLVAATAESAHIYFPCYFAQHQREKMQESRTSIMQKMLFIPKSLNSPVSSLLVHPGSIQYPFEDLALAAAGLGFSNDIPDQDGIIRRIPLYYRSEQGYLPSLVLAGICDFLQVDLSEIRISYNHYIILKNATCNGIQKDFFIPIVGDGILIINFPGPADQSLTQYSLNRVIEELETERSPLPGLLKNTCVLIGDISTAGKDFRRGIFDKIFPNSFVLGSVLNMILTENYITTAGPVKNIALHTLVLVLIILFQFTTRNRFSRRWCIKYLLFIVVSFLFILILGFCFFYCFNTQIRMAELLLGIIIVAFALYAHKLSKFQELYESGPNEKDIVNSEPIPDARSAGPETTLKALGIITERQQETALLLLKGLTNQEIADKLYITVFAVKKRVRIIYKKCKVKNKQEFIRKVYGIR